MFLLSWLGRRATAALAGGALLGLALPWLADVFRSALPQIVFVFIVASFLNIDGSTMRQAWRVPLVPCAVLAWCMIGLPIVLAAALNLIPMEAGLRQALLIWGVSPPMTAAIVFAILLRLDVSLATGVALTSVIVVPFTAPVLVLYLTDVNLAVESIDLFVRVALFVSVALLVAAAIRRAIGSAYIAAHGDALNGLVILTLIAYAAALTSGIGAEFLASPKRVLLYLAASAGVNVIAQAGTAALFSSLGRHTGMTAALLAGNRNMSVLCANLGPAFTPDIVLFFAISHIPIYTLPWLLRGLYARIAASRGHAASSIPHSRIAR